MPWDCNRSLCIILLRAVIYLLGRAFAISRVCNTFLWEFIWIKLILLISYLSRAVTCCFTSVAFFFFFSPCSNINSVNIVPFPGQVCVQICTKSVQTNCDVFLMPHEQIYCVRSPIKIPQCLESAPATAHRKFCVKSALYICPVLEHLLFTSAGDKAVHEAVLCPGLLLSEVRSIQLGLFLSQQWYTPSWGALCSASGWPRNPTAP